MLRLDKYLANGAFLSRRQAAEALRSGRVTVNGAVERSAARKVDEEADEVHIDGKVVEYARFRYYMVNKPAGYVSSTDDPGGPTVLELLPEEQRRGLFPCGRLDKSTVGLIILTDDGMLAHDLLSPKKHAEKEYYFKTERAVTEEDRRELERGVDVGTYVTKPCTVVLESPESGTITLTEGKYHQIKEMFKNRCNKVTYLRRVSFGGVRLDASLPEGAYRALREEEVETLKMNRKSGSRDDKTDLEDGGRAKRG